MWRYKKGQPVTVVFEGVVDTLWGTDEESLYRVSLPIKEGTHEGVKTIKVDVSEENFIDMSIDDLLSKERV